MVQRNGGDVDNNADVDKMSKMASSYETLILLFLLMLQMFNCLFCAGKYACCGNAKHFTSNHRPSVFKRKIDCRVSPWKWLFVNIMTFFRLILMFIYSTATLWDVLQHWETQSKLKPALSSLTSAIPVCIYLWKAVSSVDALQTTSLLELGISNGKAAIRW